VDDVEERRQPVDLVELARQGSREIEAESIDVALDSEIAERVHDQPQDAWMRGVQAVSGAGVVDVEPGFVCGEAVIRRVVDASK
jgi:hypothetical protein